MPTACINQPGYRIGLCSERLEVTGRHPETGVMGLRREIPLRDLERLLMQESVQITSAALAELLRREIPVALLSGDGRYLGGFLPAVNTHARARLRQYEVGLDPAARLALARPLVAAKLYNQRRVVQRLAANRERDAEFAPDSRGWATCSPWPGEPGARTSCGATREPPRRAIFSAGPGFCRRNPPLNIAPPGRRTTR